jgi:hypothetical protein
MLLWLNQVYGLCEVHLLVQSIFRITDICRWIESTDLRIDLSRRARVYLGAQP